MAITSTFNVGAGVLIEVGDANDNTITTSRDAAGTILVNGGAVPIQGDTATVANTNLIEALGQGGNDTLSLDETNGALPTAFFVGGDGNDLLSGGSAADELVGQGDNDTILGKGGDDLLDGGDGDDALAGGSGNDKISGGDGNDRIIWDAGDGSDQVDGDAGIDTLEAFGGNGGETFAITPNFGRVRVEGNGPAPFVLDVGATEKVVIRANGGDDTIIASNGLAALTNLTIDGGAGNDTITGGDGDDLLLGGDGNDTVTGGRGDDVALLGAGNDVFFWNPGDGSDTVEGEAGLDGLIFNGANGDENVDISANGDKVNFLRDVDSVTIELDGVEGIRVRAFGGADNIVINDVSGTDLPGAGIAVDLEGTLGSGVGDGAVDTVIVNATAGNDAITVNTVNGIVKVVGAAAPVNIFHAEANDKLAVNGGAGDDTIDASGLTGGPIRIDGGAGNDTIIGSAGADVLLGGDGNDAVTGGRGDDLAFLGAGNDVFVWNPGDGSDTIEGQDGLDGLIFNGANVNENIDISANGERVRFFRDVANVTMDLNDVEGIKFEALGGADNIVINDLTGTDLPGAAVAIDLEGAVGSGVGDGAVDTVAVNATAGGDGISLRIAGNGAIQITGAPAPVNIFHSEATDQLVINGGAGGDIIDASALPAGHISLTLNGGLGDDLLVGSQGNDLVVGGDGDDLAFLGAGNDTFVWNPGDDNDTIEGQAGVDALDFRGANSGESIDISANGTRVNFSRDVVTVTMDLNGVEGIIFHALGGVDNIVINDVSGTDLALSGVAIDLEGSLGSGLGDGEIDRVTVNGRAGDDNMNISTVNGVVFTTGSAGTVAIFHAEANDELIVNGGAGNDSISAAALTASSANLLVLGGDGDDGIFGGQGNDTIAGDNGNDTLLGATGNDSLLGGAGNDVLIGGAGIDLLTGGDGQDTFLFTGASLATLDTGLGANRDAIQDFSGDILDLHQIDANLNTAGDQAFSFIGTNAFSAAGQVRFFQDGTGNTIVEGNLDNDLHADFQIQLSDRIVDLQAGNFVL